VDEFKDAAQEAIKGVISRQRTWGVPMPVF
jgi:isoleucyl-tRNA synthetase